MSQKSILKKMWCVCILAMVCCCLWGSAFPGIKIGYQLWKIESTDTSAQVLFAGWRFFLAGVLTIIIGSFLQGKILKPTPKAIKPILVLAAFQTIIQYIFFYVGLAHTTGVKASIITGANVFLSIIIAGFVAHQEKMTKEKIIGCICGFLGVILVNMQSGNIELAFTWNGDGFIFLSALSSAISAVLIKSFSKDSNTVLLSGYQFLTGGILLIIVGFVSGGRIQVYQIGGIGILVYLAFVSAVAYSLWGILLKYNPVSKVAIFGFINPIAGVLLSALLLSESQSIGLMTVIALALVSLGIYIVNRHKSNEENISENGLEENN